MKKKIHTQIFRFVITGFLTTGVDWILFYILVHLGVLYLIANIFSVFMGTVFSYILSSKWVFNKSKLKKKHIEVIVYFGLTVIYYFLNELILYLLVNIGVEVFISKIITTGILLFYSFISRKIFLFH